MLDLTTKDLDCRHQHKNDCGTCTHDYKARSTRKLPHVRVTCWDKNAVKSSYGFTGKIDLDRLCRDAFGEGAEVVQAVSSIRTKMAGLTSTGVTVSRDKYPSIGAWQLGLPSGLMGNYFVLPESDIVAAIREHNKPKVPEWLKEGWWIYGCGSHTLVQFVNVMPDGDYLVNDARYGGGECKQGTFFRTATLEDLAVTRNGVKLWARESSNGRYIYITDKPYSNGKWLSKTTKRGTTPEQLKAIWDGPVVPYAQLMYLTKGGK